MTAIDSIPTYILAPFIIDAGEDGDIEIELREGVADRLRDGHFSTDFSSEATSDHHMISLIPSTVVDTERTLTIEEKVQREFGHPIPKMEWAKSVNEQFAERRRTVRRQDASGGDQQASTRPYDDLFTVKIDNLPDNTGPNDLRDLFHYEGTNYYKKVIVPYADDKVSYRRVAFIKFEYLRYALIFLEDYRSFRYKDMVCSSQLIT